MDGEKRGCRTGIGQADKQTMSPEQNVDSFLFPGPFSYNFSKCSTYSLRCRMIYVVPGAVRQGGHSF